MFLRLFQAWLLIWLCADAIAEQTKLSNIDQAEHAFWDQVYKKGSWTLYCGEKFSGKRGLTMEAIYSMEWVRKHLGCQSISACRAKSERFNRIEADLHNYYPVLLMIGRARNDYEFGQVPGEFREYFECDYETDGQDRLVEPRRAATGNIARALLYMHSEYQLPLSEFQIKQSKRWHADDPPSGDEKRRNKVIEAIQGTRNPYVDDPAAVEKLSP